MKLIFVAGPEGIDRKSIIDLAIQRSKKKYVHIDFDDVGEIRDEMKTADSSFMTKQISTVFYEGLEKDLIKAIRSAGKDVIVNGYLTFRVPETGYAPAVPESFFKIYKPDLIILLEKVPKKNRDLKEHQELNRYYGAFYSLAAGAILRIIRVDDNNIMDAVNNISKLIRI